MAVRTASKGSSSSQASRVLKGSDGRPLSNQYRTESRLIAKRKRTGCKMCSFNRKDKKLLEEFRQEIKTDEHMIDLEELRKRYDTNFEVGLTPVQITALLEKYGKNQLKIAKSKSLLLIFIEYMFGGFAIILWIGGGLSLVCYFLKRSVSDDASYDELVLAIVMFAICLGTGIFGFEQEKASHKLMVGFSKMVPKTANVIRSGQTVVINSEDLVPGDIVNITSGDCVPADMRILQCTSLKVDNSSITGESEPQTRSALCTDENPLETANLSFFGSHVLEGSGTGVVIATGQNTLIGHIATLTSGLESDTTPIKKEVNQFIRFITIYAVFVSISFFAIGLLCKFPLIEMFLYFIGIMVANIPEALLVTITACLTLMAHNMTSKNCMVKNMHAIETLGQTNVICSDKTGTLTQNRMTVSHMFYDQGIFDVLSDAYTNGDSTNFLYLCRCGILCSRASFKSGQSKVPIRDRVVLGDASETAVLKCMQIVTRNVANTRKQYPKLFEIPFNSTNKFQVSLHSRPYDDDVLLVMKGAPERLLDRCSTIIIEEAEYELNDVQMKRLNHTLRELGYMGERILGFADFKLPPEFHKNYPFQDNPPNFPINGLRFLGFMSMIDPPRPGVSQSIATCKKAGIRVVMVTGDHPITAMAISRKIGLISPENTTVYDIAMRRSISMKQITETDAKACQAMVISGNELRNMNTSLLEACCIKYKELVFARTSPQQKLQIVEAFQNVGNVVAVTGDGVNDSPALKRADIGIAMGITGSEVSKEAADLILLDDNFTSIVTGIEQGRLIYDNLKKSIAYLLTSNIPEVVPFGVFVFLGTPKMVTVIAVLIMDIGTDLWPSISLAYEGPESDIMNLMPRDSKKDNLVTAKLILFCYLNIGTAQTLGGLAAWFYTMSQYGFLPSRLIGIQPEWDSGSNDVVDSYGFEWTYEDRKMLERNGVSIYFLAIVVTQIADLMITKTRRLSIAQHGMNNNTMIKALIFECFIACTVVYLPYVNILLGFGPVSPYCLWPALPFALFIIIYDEIRKYIIRVNPQGWIAVNTYY